MKLISVFGQMAFGKDMVVDCLIEKLNKQVETKWTHTSFASAVKNVFCESFGVSREFIEEWKRNPENPPGMLMPLRQALQFIGDGFRKIKSGIWVEIALRGDNLILSDGRYINESIEVKARNGITIVLYRPGFVNSDPNPSESEIKPIAEFCAKYLKDGPIPKYEILKEKYGDECPKEMQYFDYFLNNDGTLYDLYKKVEDLLIPYINEKM